MFGSKCLTIPHTHTQDSPLNLVPVSLCFFFGFWGNLYNAGSGVLQAVCPAGEIKVSAPRGEQGELLAIFVWRERTQSSLFGIGFRWATSFMDAMWVW